MPTPASPSHSNWSVQLPAGDVAVDVWGTQNRPLVCLAHGAGSTMDTALLVKLQQQLVGRKFTAARFNFPYTQKGRKAPDKPRVLMQTVAAVATAVSAHWKPGRLVLGGKSMGGRMASMLVAEGFQADGLVFLGYPLHPIGKPNDLRKEHLFNITCPMLFISGTTDKLARLDLLQTTVDELGPRARLVLLDGADHSLDHAHLEAAPFAAEAITRWYKDCIDRSHTTRSSSHGVRMQPLKSP